MTDSTIPLSLWIHDGIILCNIFFFTNFDPLTCKTSNKADGRTSSTAPISFENLLRIRPEGFVWKNRMGARVMAENMLLCSRVEARMAIEKNINERSKEITTRAITMAGNEKYKLINRSHLSVPF